MFKHLLKLFDYNDIHVSSASTGIRNTVLFVLVNTDPKTLRGGQKSWDNIEQNIYNLWKEKMEKI